jgi:hypothetical protein
MMARWIRLRSGLRGEGARGIEPLEFDEAWARLAVAQTRHASPILLWGEGDASYPFALIAPLRIVPGRRIRWPSWGLTPAVATYRQFRVPAYLNDGDIWLHGRRISESAVEVIGECVVLASSFLMQFPGSCVATPSTALEQAFRHRLEAQHGWQFEHSWPSEAEMPNYTMA